ncbi:hypothetical protein EV379_3101 [Microterricola gilva]|uniref:F5/8 type C domain-containing protein n=1 Tax=Microterricola gilva TaxID=393267 RepID=A0A4Q8ARK3_9MICO|nr:hypothetical protein [Microterricola gilva]RZU66735.1 hypothetical protein EV379_3101 [Microterricola gilva]
MERTRLFLRAGAVALAATVCIGVVPVGAAQAGVRTVTAQADAGAAASAADWEKVSAIVGGIYGEWRGDAYGGAISNSVPNTALLGNGDVGVTSYGAKGQKSFLISKSDFYSAGDLKGVFNSGNNLTKPLPVGGITIQGKPDDAASEPNLAPTRSAVSASGQHDAFAPALAVNGAMQNDANGYGWVTGVGRTHWLEVSFPEAISVQRWVVKNDGAVRSGYSANNTSAFRLQVSETGGPGATWTDVSVVDNNTADVFDQNLEQAVSSKHFRLYVTNPLQQSNTDANPRARIGQFELYAETKAPTAPEATVETHEKQDILNATIETSMALGGVPVEMDTWLAPSGNVMVTELVSKGDRAVELEVQTWGKPGNGSYPVASSVEDGVATANRSTFNNAPANPDSWRSQAALATEVVGAETTVSADSAKGMGLTTFTLPAGETVQLVTAVGGGGKNFGPDGTLLTDDPVAEAVAMVADAASADRLAALEGEHADWWKDFWSASYIDLPNRPEVMRYYYGAQYMLGSTSREGELAPGLFGIWHTTDNPSWSGDYHLNYNFIATFYGTNSSNRPELSLPAVDAMLSFVPKGVQRAADPAQLRRINKGFVDGRPDLQNGIADALLYPVGIGPWGTVTDDNYLSEALNAAYSAYPLIQYYHYTQDTEYLEEHIYDYLKKAVNFYDAWLDKSGDTYTLFAGYNEGSWATNPAVELAALKSVLTELIDASVVLDKDADKREHWQGILDKLAPQPTSEWAGKKVYSLAEKEWKNGQWVPLANPVPGDGNIIPLDIVVPGGQLGYYSTADEQQTARNTIDVFGNNAWRQINNFPRIFNDAVQSRYPADGVLANLTNTIKSQIQPNLRISDGNHGVEKIGATAAVNNMLLMTDQGVTKVFPNWVAGENASFSKLRAEGAFVLSASYDGASNTVSEISVTSEAGKPLTLAVPWGEGVHVVDSSGATIATTLGTAPNWSSEITATFNTVAGESYTVRQQGEPHAISVRNGASTPETARAGDTVTLTANAAADFHEFAGWTGGGVTFADAEEAETTFTMPDQDVALEATFASTVPVLAATARQQNKLSAIDFAIRSANGKGYTVYVSESGAPGSFTEYDAKYNSKGARLSGLKAGQELYAYVVYREGGTVVEVTSTVTLTP